MEALRGGAGSAAAEGSLVEWSIPVRNGEIQLAGPDDYYLPLRLPLVVHGENGPTITEVLTLDRVLFDPIRFIWAGRLDVILTSFCWNDCTLRLPSSEGLLWLPLESWFKRWFDAEPESNADTPSQVIHSLGVNRDGDAVHLVTDFGTAPVQAFQDLLNAILQMDVSHVHIGDGAADADE